MTGKARDNNVLVLSTDYIRNSTDVNHPLKGSVLQRHFLQKNKWYAEKCIKGVYQRHLDSSAVMYNMLASTDLLLLTQDLKTFSKLRTSWQTMLKYWMTRVDMKKWLSAGWKLQKSVCASGNTSGCTNTFLQLANGLKSFYNLTLV